MKSIAIVGTGQSGLILAFSLLQHGYKVTIYNDRTPEDILSGSIMSSQALFASALQIEQSLELNFWDEECPKNKSISFAIADQRSGQKLLSWQGKVSKPFQAVDQRLKYSSWLQEFKKRGGALHILKTTIDDLNIIALQHDLTVVAVGKGELKKCFEVNKFRSTHNTPQRKLMCLYVKGMKPEAQMPGVRATIIPGIGEYFTMPGLTTSGPCEMMLFEAVPNSPFDYWDIPDRNEVLRQCLGLLEKYVPWEAERCENIYLTDELAMLSGNYTPQVRYPTCKLECGKYILGMGDAVVLNDPVAGQGANNATKCAKLYSDSIVSRGEHEFDEEWMISTFEMYWSECARAATLWSNMLLAPPPEHVLNLLSQAANFENIANKLADGFDNPNDFFSWILDPIQTRSWIEHNKYNAANTYQNKKMVEEQ